MNRLTCCLFIVLAALAATGASAQYNYGGGGRGGGGYGDSGFLLLLEAGMVNPRNADNVVSTDLAGGVSPIIPAWNDELAGRIGIGWGFASGNRVMATVWGFQTEQSDAGSGNFAFAIGPPIPSGTADGYVGDKGAFYAAATELNAATADLEWGHNLAVGEKLLLDFSAGLRMVMFEETQTAIYNETTGVSGPNSFLGDKSNEATMLGARIGFGVRYRFAGNFSFAGRLAYAALDGELEAHSVLAATGSGNSSAGANRSDVVDDGRSGSTTDLGVEVTWHLSADSVRLSLGWEQATWDGVPADLVRNFPGTTAPLRDRNSVSFSGYKLGVWLRF